MDSKDHLIEMFYSENRIYAEQVEQLANEVNELSKINDIFDNYINNDCIGLGIDETIEKLKDAGASSKQIIDMGFEEEKVRDLFNEREIDFDEERGL